MKKILSILLLWLLFAVPSFAAFPTNTTLLENFDSVADWTSVSGNLSASGGLGLGGGAGANTSFLTGSDDGPDVDYTLEVPTVPASGDYLVIFAKIADLGNGGDGYAVQYYNGTLGVYRVDNGGFSGVLNSDTISLSNGDSIGLSYVNGDIIAYHKPSAGSWTEIARATDTTYEEQTGVIALNVFDTVTRVDNLRGGDYVAPSTSIPVIQNHHLRH